MNRETGANASTFASQTFSQDSELPEISLRDLLDVFRRRWRLFFGSVAFIVVISALTVFQLTPLYEAQTTVMVAPRSQQIVDIQAVVSGLSSDAQAVESEMQVLRSRGLMKQVIEETRLDQYPEFNPAHEDNQGGIVAGLLDGRWISVIRGDIAREDLDPDIRRQLIQAEIVESMLERLEVATVGRSRVLRIGFASEDRQLAAEVTNAIADLYIAQQIQLKADAARQATVWLSDRLDVLRADVGRAEQAAEEFRARAATVDGRDDALIAQQISQTSSEIIRTRAEYDTARVRLERTEELLRANGQEAVLELIDPDLAARYLEIIVRLRQTEAPLTAQYGPSHPVVVGLRDRIDALSRQTAENLIANLRSEVAVATARLQSLEDSLAAFLEDSIQVKRALIDLRSLESEAAASRTLFETFLNRFKETEQTGIEQPDSWIISRAEIPTRPSYPRKSLLLSIVFIGACGAGAMLVFAAEQLEGGLRSVEEVERALGTTGLGMIPRVRTGGGATRPQDVVTSDPLSVYAEAHRSLHTALMIAGMQGGAVVLVASALPGDGKSSLVMSLARANAKSGKRVIMLDGDLRHPSLHTALGLPNETGLTSYLSGAAKLKDVRQIDESSGAALIAAGPMVDDPPEQLRLPRFAELVTALRTESDLVLIDSPPIIPVSDALILAGHADQTVVAAKWRATPQKAVRRALDQLRDARATIAGVVLTQVDGHRHPEYGDWQYGYRYRGAGD